MNKAGLICFFAVLLKLSNESRLPRG